MAWCVCHQSNIRECLRLSFKSVNAVVPVWVPKVAQFVESHHHGIFNRSTER